MCWVCQLIVYDILGLVQSVNSPIISETECEKAVQELKNIKQQTYPPFSSKPVLGKPLFQWMREGKIDQIEIPKRSVGIYNLKYIGRQTVEANNFEESVINRIQSVEGDFRQNECITSWQNYFKNNKEEITIHTMRIYASSGTYMRSLVHHLGITLGTGACTIKIKRTQIGEYSLPKNKSLLV